MSEIAAKEGWRRVAFGDVVRQVRDRVTPENSGIVRFVAGEHMDTDDLRIRRWGQIGEGYLGPAFHMRFKPGHVLYGSRRTYLRKVAVADFEGITANTTFVMESRDPQVLLPALLPFIMQTDAFNKHSMQQSKGSVNPYINFTDLTWYEFDLPPLAEQERIVAGMSSMVALEECLGDAVLAADRLRKASIDHLIDPVSRCWPVHPIGDVVKVVTGGTPSRSTPDYWGDEIPWVKTGEVNFTVITETEEHITKEGLRNSAAKVCPADSILVALYGQGPTRGRVAMLGIAATMNQACAAILPSAEFEPWFVYYYLEGKYEALRSMAHGAAQPNLNLSMIKKFAIPVPPISEQRELLEVIGAVAKGRADLSERFYVVRNARAQLLHEALR